MEIQIRLCTSEDLPEIFELQAQSLQTLISHYHQRQIESLIRSQKAARLTDDEILFVADYQGELVGFAALQMNSPGIGGLFVHPDYMRQGIGTKLITTLENTALEKRYKKLNVFSSLAAVDFYQAKGYKIFYKSGFFSEGSIWIPCFFLEKRLLNDTESESKNGVQEIIDLISWLLMIALVFCLFLYILNLLF
jgi:putative acetyltransferase